MKPKAANTRGSFINLSSGTYPLIYIRISGTSMYSVPEITIDLTQNRYHTAAGNFTRSASSGEHIFHYADKSLQVSGSTLMFFNPPVPYTLESLSEVKSGFFCIFSKTFFTESVHGRLNQLPMFALGGKNTYFTLAIKSSKQDKIKMRVADLLGRVVELNPDILPNSTIELGRKYLTGIYIVEIVQGNEKRVTKLIKNL